jgi:hypothetical protein
MNDNGPIYSVLTGKPALFTGFARPTDNYGGSVGVQPWPATWSNTSNSFTRTTFQGYSPSYPSTLWTHVFTLSGNSGTITGTPKFFRSVTNHGGGQLDKDGLFNYDNPSSLNAGTYYVSVPGGNFNNYPSSSTATYTFANSVLASAKPFPDGTDFANFDPAANVSVSGLVTSFTVYANAQAGKVFFTVPAGSARSVTIAFINRRGNNTGWDLTTGGVNALRSIVNYNNSGWTLDKNGTYSAPYPYGLTKTLTMNPGDYIVDLRGSRYSGGYTGTITIT